MVGVGCGAGNMAREIWRGNMARKYGAKHAPSEKWGARLNTLILFLWNVGSLLILPFSSSSVPDFASI